MCAALVPHRETEFLARDAMARWGRSHPAANVDDADPRFDDNRE